MEDKKEKLPSTNINWSRRIYGKLAKSIENTELFDLGILHISIEKGINNETKYL